MTTISVLQPSYMPWLGYFDQMNKSDIFVYYDDVQFDKNGWRNRNRIKSKDGLIWLTVPVKTGNSSKLKINEIEIDRSSHWHTKHIKTLNNAYAKAPHKDFFLNHMQNNFDLDSIILSDLNIGISEFIRKYLGIECKVYKSSELNLSGDKNMRLVNLCKYFEADNYLTGNLAVEYIDKPLFDLNKINIEWQNYVHPVYPQLHGEFISHLSILDLLLNCGKSSLKFIANEKDC